MKKENLMLQDTELKEMLQKKKKKRQIKRKNMQMNK